MVDPSIAGYGAVPQLGSSTGGYSGTGAGGSPSIFGTGMYQPGAINVNQNAFNNPVGQQAGQLLSGQLNNYLGNTTQPVVAQQATGGPNGAYNTGIAGQLGLANQYGQMAAGQGPSLATVTAGQQGAANLASAESLLGSARGAGNPAAAQLAARGAQSSGAQQVAQNAVAGRTQEETNALNAEAGIFGNVTQQGLGQQGLQQGLSEYNAGQANNVGLGNQSNVLGANTNYLNTLTGINGQQQQGQIAGQQLAANTQLGQEQIANNAYNNSAQNNQKLLSGILQGASGAASMFL